jgi:putative transposase
MVKVFKYRIFPTKKQVSLLQQTLVVCCLVYNKTLEVRKRAWEEQKKSFSLYDSYGLLKDWKEELPLLSVVYTQVLRDAQHRIDLAFKGFFSRIKRGEKAGYPRFKPALRYTSFTYTQLGYKLNKSSIELSKIGTIKVKFHRPVFGLTKRVTVKKNNLGMWYLLIYADNIEPCLLSTNLKPIGVDMGLKEFAVFSDGSPPIPNPRFPKKSEKEIKKACRRFFKEGGDLRRRRTLQHIYGKVTNRQLDFAHKLSRYLVINYGTIVFEDLKIKKFFAEFFDKKHL